MPESVDDKAHQSTPAAASNSSATPRPRPRWRLYLFRLAALTLVPGLVFLLLECTLRAARYGYPTQFFLDGTYSERPGTYIDNGDFRRWVFPTDMKESPPPVPFALPAVKRTGTFRIFVVGESAALGYPDPSQSFARVLETMLRERYQDMRFEVVNTSVVAINSHVALPIAQQCLQHDADLLIVHLGNNEVVGPFGPAGVLGPYAANVSLIRAHLAIKSWRTGQLLHNLLHGRVTSAVDRRLWTGMSMFMNSQIRHDDPRLPRVYDHFADNLTEICRLASAASVPVILCTIPVNLADCPPFSSLHAADLDAPRLQAWNDTYVEGTRLQGAGRHSEALAHYERAAAIAADFAELSYRTGQCYEALGKRVEAREHLRRARDRDALRVRSDSHINGVIREVAAARAADGVHLADAEAIFEEHAGDDELFLEHVHMTFKGNYLLARLLLESIQALAPEALAGAESEKPVMLSEQQCADHLAFTTWNDLSIRRQIYHAFIQNSNSPFAGQFDIEERRQRWQNKLEAVREQMRRTGAPKIIATYQNALQRSPDDWLIHLHFGLLLAELGRLEDAEEQLRASQRCLRHAFPACCKLGGVLLDLGKLEQSLEQFQEALRRNPGSSEASRGLGETHRRLGDRAHAAGLTVEAQRHYQAARRFLPDQQDP